MVNLSENLVGWSLLASAILSIVGYVFLILMFTVRTNPFGPLNDVFVVLSFLALLPFVFTADMNGQIRNIIYRVIFIASAIVGIFIISFYQLRLVFGKISLKFNMPRVVFGSGLVGISLLLGNNPYIHNGLIPQALLWLGFITGAAMAFGIPGGIFFGNDLFEIMTGKRKFQDLTFAAVIVYGLNFLSQPGFILWAIWMGIALVWG
jgi:hypothetical protein